MATLKEKWSTYPVWRKILISILLSLSILTILIVVLICIFAEDKIVATVEDFKKVPMFSQSEMNIINRKGGTEYNWKNVSMLGNPNFVTLYDDNSDEKIDQILMVVMILFNDPRTTVEAIGILYKVTTLAAGTDISIEKYTDLIEECIKKGEVQKRYGTIVEGLNYTPATGGGVILASINEKKK